MAVKKNFTGYMAYYYCVFTIANLDSKIAIIHKLSSGKHQWTSSNRGSSLKTCWML